MLLSLSRPKEEENVSLIIYIITTSITMLHQISDKASKKCNIFDISRRFFIFSAAIYLTI